MRFSLGMLRPACRSFLLAVPVLTMVSHSAVAATLDDAIALWKFDGAASGSASSGQIVDAQGNYTASSATRLSWTTVPTTGPAGGPAIDSVGRGLSFDPVVTATTVGTGNDTVAAATFAVAGGTVSENLTFLTRFRWDGPAPGDTGVTPDDTPDTFWMINNGLGGDGKGLLFGLKSDTLGETAKLYYYTAGYTGTGGGVAGGTRSVTSSFSLTVGEWYDIGLVLDTGDGSALTYVDNTVTFYLNGTTGGLQSQTVSGVYISGAATNVPGANMVVGSESTGTGSGNQRKTIDGTMDYLAVFDTALTQSEVSAVIVPEPGSGLLCAAGALGLGLRRRRRS